MSGMSADDLTKEQIMKLLQDLKKSAEANNDTDLLFKIKVIETKVYELETY